MNIFYLDKDPKICATMHCDKHVVKMIIEYAQLLSTAHRVLDGISTKVLTKSNRKYTTWIHPTPLMETTLYKSTMQGHPSAVWSRQNLSHYIYLKELWKNLCDEYTHRYGRVHITYTKLSDVLEVNPINIPNTPFKDPPPAMSHFPLCIVPNNSLYSYYNYYIVAKNYFAKWTKRPIPEWYSTGLSTKKLYANL